MAAGLLIIQLGRPVGEKTGVKKRVFCEGKTRSVRCHPDAACIYACMVYILHIIVYVCIFIDTYMHMIVSVYIIYFSMILSMFATCFYFTRMKGSTIDANLYYYTFTNSFGSYMDWGEQDLSIFAEFRLEKNPSDRLITNG